MLNNLLVCSGLFDTDALSLHPESDMFDILKELHNSNAIRTFDITHAETLDPKDKYNL